MDSIAFFSVPENQRMLREFAEWAKTFAGSSSSQTTRDKSDFLSSVFSLVIKNASRFDENCQINISWIAESIRANAYGDPAKRTEEDLDDMVSSIYRVILEFEMSVKERLSPELRHFQEYVRNNLQLFSEEAQRGITFAVRDMPLQMVKELINHVGLESLKQVPALSERVAKDIQEWNGKLEDQTQRASALAESLSSYENAFNFVGLAEGFRELINGKVKELARLRVAMGLLGVVVLFPVCLELWFLRTLTAAPTVPPLFLIISVAVATLGLTLLLVYFFRIALHSANSVKSQLLQIELRLTLCRFIQNYATYAKKMRADGQESLVKFENIIFSGIVSSDERLPTTYDGLEQLSGFISALRQKSA